MPDKLHLSQDDIDVIERLVATEVDHRLAKRDPIAYAEQVRGVTDTVLNRVASDQFPNTAREVANQHRQFSAITGPYNPAKGTGIYKGDVANVPGRSVPSGMRGIVEQHIKQREAGFPSSVDGGLHYANPSYITANNRGWVDALAGPEFGRGQSTHIHGTTAGFTPTEAYLGDFEQSPYSRSGPTGQTQLDQALYEQGFMTGPLDYELGDTLYTLPQSQPGATLDALPRSKPISQDQYSVMGALDQIDGFDTKQDMPVYNPAQEPVQGLAAIDDLFSMEGAKSLPAAPLGSVDAFALDDLPSIGGGVDYGVSDTPMGQGSGSLPNLSLDDFGGPVAPSISLRGNNDFWAAEDRAQEAAMNDLERNDTLSSSLASLERAGLLDQLDSINAPPEIADPENNDVGSGPSAPGTGAFSLGNDWYSNEPTSFDLPDTLDTLPQSKPVAPIDLVGDVQPLYEDYQPVEPVSQPVADYTLPDTLGALPRSKPQASTLAAQKAAKKMTGLATTALGGAVAGPLGALGGYALGKAIGGPVSNRVGDFVSGGYVGPSGHTYATDTGISRGLAKVDQTGNWGDFWDSNSQTDQTAQMAWDREKAAREGRQIKSLLDAFTDDLSDAFSGKKTVTGGQTSVDTSRQRNSSDRDSSSSSGRSSGGGLFSSLFGGRDDKEDDNSGERSSGGGTIICSELYRQGYLSKELWQADEKWGHMTARKDPDIIRGYRTWAAPIVRLMKRSPDATRIIAKLTEPWARQMAYEAGYLPKGNFLGWLTNMVGIPFSWLVGKGLKLHKKWRRKWQA